MWSEREVSADKTSGLDRLDMNLQILCIISGLGGQLGLAISDTTFFTLKQKFKGIKKSHNFHTHMWPRAKYLKLIGIVAELQ